jgi:hypothetical protein
VLCVPQLLTLNSGFEYFYLRARGPPPCHGCTQHGRMHGRNVDGDRHRSAPPARAGLVCFNARWTLNRWAKNTTFTFTPHRTRLYRYR